MRSFSPKRLYKLIFTLVVLVTLGSALIAYAQYNQYRYFTSEYMKESKKCEVKKGVEYRQCMIYTGADSDIQLAYQSTQFVNRALASAILTPILFFSVLGLFKYLFPSKK